MWVILVLIALPFVMLAFQKYREIQGRRMMSGDWIIRTSRSAAELDELIVKGMKGLNPLAAVTRSGSQYQREISKGNPDKWYGNSATLSVGVFPAGEAAGSDVQCAIAHWQGGTFLGVPDVNSIRACRRRIRAIISRIQSLDPSATLLSDPMRPEAAAAPHHAEQQMIEEDRDEERPLESSVTTVQKEVEQTFESPLTSPAREPAAAARPGRPWACEPQGASFTYIESLRVNLPEADGAYATLERLGESLAEKLGRPPFAGVALDDAGRCITPWWASVGDAYLHASGDVTAAGWPAHALFRLPHVLDLGAVDGRNRDRWSGQAPQGMVWPNDHLYAGSNRESRFEMSAVAGSVQSLDLTRDGLRVLCLEHWGSSRFVLGWADARTGERRYLLDPGRLSGGERLQLSPDERWALLSAHPEPLLIDLEAATAVRLPVGTCAGASWWPAAGASVVAALLITDDGMHLARLDLASGTSTDEGPLVIPSNDLPPDRRHVYDLVVHPRGNEALVGASFGAPYRHQEKYGGRSRVAHLDLESRRVDVLVAPFLDDDPRLERQHSKWRWTGEPEAAPTVVAETVRAHAVPMAGGPPADAAYAATDARDLAVLAGRALVQHWDDPHRVRSEALRGFEGSCRWGRNDKLVEWFAAITEEITSGTASMAAEAGGRALLAHAQAALAFAAAERKIREGRAAEIDWAADSMTGEAGRAEDAGPAGKSEGTLTLADGRSFSYDVQCSDCEHWGTRHVCRARAGPRRGDVTEPVSACDSFSVGTGQVLLTESSMAIAAGQTQDALDLLHEALEYTLADEERIYATCMSADLLMDDQQDKGVALWEQALALDRESGVQRVYEMRDWLRQLDGHYAGVGDHLVKSGEWREAIPFLEAKLSLCDHMPVNPLIFTATILGPLWWVEGRHAGPRSLERRGADLLRTVIATKEIDLFGSFGDTVRDIARSRMDKLEELARKRA